jgi:hypothetical protein
MVVGKNVAIEVSGSMAHVAVDMAKDQGASKTGKSVIIGTTGGKHIEVPGNPGVFFTLTMYRKNAPKA